MQQNLNIEKIIFKVVQMKFLAMHFTNQKLFVYKITCPTVNITKVIFTVGHVLNIFNMILIS